MPIFRACKNAKIALQHPIIFGVLASPCTTLKTEKRKFACSWEMKSVSGHLKNGKAKKSSKMEKLTLFYLPSLSRNEMMWEKDMVLREDLSMDQGTHFVVC